MTFEEFKELALNPPEYEGVKIYRLEVFGYYDEWINEDDDYGLVHANTSYYTSLERAQSALLPIYDSVSKKGGLKIYCSLIYEIPTGIDMRFAKYTRVFSFDDEGELIDHTLCAYPCGINDEKYEIFRGRDQGMIRFQPGDIVEVLTLWEEQEPSVGTAIITKTPPTIKDSWKLYEQLGELFIDGIESDEYWYLVGEHWLAGYNSSTPSFLVFKPHKAVSEQRQKELLEYYRNYTGQAYWRQGGSRLDEIAQSAGGLSSNMHPGFKSLKPSDFDPIYEGTEVVHIFGTADFNVENPLETIFASIEERTGNTLSNFSNFIICISNTDWHGKHLNPKRISEWEKIIEEKLPNSSNVIWGERIMEGAMFYRIDIVAYKKYS